MQIKLYNTLENKVCDFSPIKNNSVGIYSCGPTVYDYAHIGNLRAFLFADLLQRVLKVVGEYDVKWIMNITDIDDKTIKSIQKDSGKWLKEMGVWKGEPENDIRNYTNYFLNKFKEDIEAVGINLNDFDQMPRATDHIQSMMDLIQKIHKNGFAYISEGNVYFDVSKWREKENYGRLKNIDFENFQKGVRIDSDEYEREQVSDFVLWKNHREGEPAWDLNLNGQTLKGRPGWHLECSAMEYELLGLPFDIHTGGVDLQFPHHEDEIAQSHAGYGIDPTNFWCHNEFLEVEGKKMSKKLGNFFTLRDLQEKGYDAKDIRFLILNQHYRTKFNFTLKGIEDSKKSKDKIQNYIDQILEEKENLTSGNISDDSESLKIKVFSHLANDLHTPKAIAEVFSFISRNKISNLNQESANNLLNFFFELNKIYNVWDFEVKTSEIPNNVKDLAEKRLEAKKDKKWEEADKLRNKIMELGWVVKDTKDSYELEKK